jgi:hypothetical protein
MPMPLGFRGARRPYVMRQWELFGITDRDPNWTPPKADREPDSVVTVLEVCRDDEDLLPEPAA